ncbi:ABC transporter ATP-binding protein [Ferviditalea candida]|uniref:ABC transporter ATP-binding protein n=1 Tax=Ferviditalea candida TaxID=3108399 RepID=A0ABU5ZFT3_9BACL|nr:ABC transporter ATP-binding protein [Paenibacillaceae bacterium T2]
MSMQKHDFDAEVEVLRLEGVGKSFGGLKILQDLSFSVKQGERRAFIGPNGAGKSTLFNIIAGDLEPSAGEVVYFSEKITGMPNFGRVRNGLVRTFQRNNLLNELTVMENLLLALQVKEGVEHIWFRPRERRYFAKMYDRAEELLETWGLYDRRNSRVKQLSYGEQRQAEILLGIAMEPKVLLLDEPTAGMSNKETQYILDLLQRLPKDLTLLIIEHDMEVVFGVAEKVTVLHNGGILLEGDPQIIRNDPRVYEIYFGEDGVL